MYLYNQYVQKKAHNNTVHSISVVYWWKGIFQANDEREKWLQIFW